MLNLFKSPEMITTLMGPYFCQYFINGTNLRLYDLPEAR